LYHYNISRLRLRLHLFNIKTLGHQHSISDLSSTANNAERIKSGALVRSVGGGYGGGVGAQGTERDVDIDGGLW
jgi:hypothetical protein